MSVILEVIVSVFIGYMFTRMNNFEEKLDRIEDEILMIEMSIEKRKENDSNC